MLKINTFPADAQPPGEKCGLALSQIGRIFGEAYRELERERPCPPIRVEYYGFVGINHTVRLREGRLLVRLSDLFKRAPAPVLEALAAILLAKLYRRNLPRAARAVYREYSNSPEMRRKAQVSRRKRGRKLLAGPAGSRYHLTALFDDLNRQYFKGRLPLVRLGWSLRKSRRILGHFDPSHRTITLSRWLDRPRVPEVVVRFVLFHEMLHAKFLARSCFDVRNPHSRRFREEEQTFRGHDEARNWIRTCC